MCLCLFLYIHRYEDRIGWAWYWGLFLANGTLWRVGTLFFKAKHFFLLKDWTFWLIICRVLWGQFWSGTSLLREQWGRRSFCKCKENYPVLHSSKAFFTCLTWFLLWNALLYVYNHMSPQLFMQIYLLWMNLRGSQPAMFCIPRLKRAW